MWLVSFHRSVWQVDPNDAARIWSVKQDAWGRPYYENLITQETTTDKPAVSSSSSGGGVNSITSK